MVTLAATLSSVEIGEVILAVHHGFGAKFLLLKIAAVVLAIAGNTP